MTTMEKEPLDVEELLTVEELAARLKVPRSWVYQRTRARDSDRLPHIKLGKYLRFESEAVEAWLDCQRKEYPEFSTRATK